MLMLEGHISKAFDGALATLHLRVLEMGGLVLDQVREAARAFTDWNDAYASQVLAREGRVSEYARSLGDEQLTLIALRQPVARDLRVIIALARIVADLERAGGEARKIAATVLRSADGPGPGSVRDARHIGQLAVALLRLALEALDNIDPVRAAEVIERDEEIDQEYGAGLRRLLTRAIEDPRHFELTLDTAFTLKGLERIGDHARNIARHVSGIAADRANGHGRAAPGQARDAGG